MTTYRGLDGFLALGGALTGSPLLTAALATGDTELNVTGGGSTLTGILCVGDVFTLGGETNTPKYRVKTSCYAATGTAIAATIPFEPGASEVIAEDASLVIQSNSMAEARLWNLNTESELLDSTVLGDKWRTFYADATLFGSWSGSGEAFLDYADEEQASLINAIASPANLMEYPFDFSNWDISETPTLTTNVSDPFGGNGAFTVADDSSVNSEFIQSTTNTVALDGEKSMSLYVKEGTSDKSHIKWRNGATDNKQDVALTWVDSEPILTSEDGGGTIWPPEDVGDGWWLLKMSATAVPASNDHFMRIFPADAAGDEGTLHIYGAKAADAPRPGSLFPPEAPTVAMLFSVAADKQFYGYAKLSNLSITAQKGELVTISYDFEGTGALRPNWT